MTKEEQIKKELNKMLSMEIDNASTIILINAKVSDLCLEFFNRGFKSASDIAIEMAGERKI